jgi:hypothetical protein
MSAEKLSFEAKGGKPATLTASKASLPTHSGSKCPETASLTVKYNVEAPSPTHLEGVPSKFCGNTLNVDGTCSAVNVYTGAVTGTMVSAEAKIKVAGGFVINCKEAPLTGANFNNVGIGEINVMEFKTTGAKCNSTITNNPLVKVTIGTPFGASVNFTDIAGMDYLTGGAALPSVTLEILNTPAITCIYNAQRSSWRVLSYAPLKMESLWAGNQRDGQPGGCPATIVAIEAEYTLKRATDNGNLWMGW